MSIAEVVVERIAVAEVAIDIIEIASKRVGRVLFENIARVLLCRGCCRLWHGLHTGEGRGGCAEKQADKEWANLFHGVVKVSGHRYIGRAHRDRCIGSEILWQGLNQNLASG